MDYEKPIFYLGLDFLIEVIFKLSVPVQYLTVRRMFLTNHNNIDNSKTIIIIISIAITTTGYFTITVSSSAMVLQS